jgi:hypothetical protein
LGSKKRTFLALFKKLIFCPSSSVIPFDWAKFCVKRKKNQDSNFTVEFNAMSKT